LLKTAVYTLANGNMQVENSKNPKSNELIARITLTGC